MADRNRPGSVTSSFANLRAAQESTEDAVGSDFVRQFHATLRTASLYDRGHPQRTKHVRSFVNAITNVCQLLGGDTVSFSWSGQHINLNHAVLRADAAISARARWIVRQFESAGIIEIDFEREIQPDEVEEFAVRLGNALSEGAPIAPLDDLPHIRIGRARRFPEFEELLSRLGKLKKFPLLQLYAEGVAHVMDWSRTLGSGRQPDYVGPRRLMGRVVDALYADAAGLVGLTLLRPLPGSFSNRQLDAAILTAAMALDLGFGDLAARDLGVATLLRSLPPSWEPWWVRVGIEPAQAARLANDRPEEIEAIVNFETVAPPVQVLPANYYGGAASRHPAAELVAVAEGFVDLLQPGEESSPFSPDIAVQTMLANAGRHFHPVAVDALVHRVGFYPPGSVVRLNSGDAAVVVKVPPRGADLRRPTVRLVDLSSTDIFALHDQRLSGYAIVDTVAPRRCTVNPLYVFLR